MTDEQYKATTKIQHAIELLNVSVQNGAEIGVDARLEMNNLKGLTATFCFTDQYVKKKSLFE